MRRDAPVETTERVLPLDAIRLDNVERLGEVGHDHDLLVGVIPQDLQERTERHQLACTIGQ